MQGQGTRMLRVKDVAARYDVSVATIYRAIESGQLDALKLGRGKGTLRVPESALRAYEEGCGRAAYEVFVTELWPAQAAGRACVICKVDYRAVDVTRVEVGRSVFGVPVFACTEHGVQAGAAGELVGEVAR